MTSNLQFVKFARLEPTTDPIQIKYGNGKAVDLVFYLDKECTKFFARKSNWNRKKKLPKKHMLNCFMYTIVVVEGTK